MLLFLKICYLTSKIKKAIIFSLTLTYIKKYFTQSSVRVGDVYALLVEFYYATNHMDKATRLVQQMLDRGIQVDRYLDSEMLDNLIGETGRQKNTLVPSDDYADEAVEEDIGEDIEEEDD